MLASGDVTDRRLLAATLAGRLDPLAGRAQVAGHPLPSESTRVARLVAMADVGGLVRDDSSVTVRELIEERMRFTQPWYRSFTSWRRVQRWIARINASLAAVTTDSLVVDGDSVISQLPQRERAVALAAVALSEGTPVVMLDQLDTFAEPADEIAYLRAVCRLASATTTIVVGTPHPLRSSDPRTSDGRPLALIDLTALQGAAL